MKSDIIFYEDKYAIIFYDTELKTLFLKYLTKIFGDDEAFIKINQFVLDTFITLDTNKFVADVRHMGIISICSQKWVMENLLPNMINHLKQKGKQLIHAQLIDKSDVLLRVSAMNIKVRSYISESLDVFQFSEEEKLITFLREL